jgi:hypothetical protein
VPTDIKAMHMVGRTNPRRRIIYTGFDVIAVIEEVGYDWYPPGWGSMGVSQQLDLVATDLLKRDRAERLGVGGPIEARRDYLSRSQSWDRSSREVPMDNERLLAMERFSPRVRIVPPR